MAFAFRGSGVRGTRMQIDKFANNPNWPFEAMALNMEFIKMPLPTFIVFAILTLAVGAVDSAMSWGLVATNPWGGFVKLLLEGIVAFWLLFRGRTLLKAGKSDLSMWETIPIWLSFLPGLLLGPVLGLLPSGIYEWARPILDLPLVTPLIWMFTVLFLTGLGVGVITTAMFGRLVGSRQTVEEFTYPLLQFVIMIWFLSIGIGFVGQSISTGGLSLSRIDIPAYNQQQDQIRRDQKILEQMRATTTPVSGFTAPPISCSTYPQCPTPTAWRPGQNK